MEHEVGVWAHRLRRRNDCSIHHRIRIFLGRVLVTLLVPLSMSREVTGATLYHTKTCEFRKNLLISESGLRFRLLVLQTSLDNFLVILPPTSTDFYVSKSSKLLGTNASQGKLLPVGSFRLSFLNADIFLLFFNAIWKPNQHFWRIKWFLNFCKSFNSEGRCITSGCDHLNKISIF